MKGRCFILFLYLFLAASPDGFPLHSLTPEKHCTGFFCNGVSRARYYNPGVGSFNQRDTFEGDNFDPQSLHKYGYVHCDPITNTDPTGELTLGGLLIRTAILAVVVTIGVIWGLPRYKKLKDVLAIENANLYEPGMAGTPNYATATALLSEARNAMNELRTPEARRYYDDFFASSAGENSVESHHVFFVQAGFGTTFYGAVPTGWKPNFVFLSPHWSAPGFFTPIQRALILLHELRHAKDNSGDTVAYRAQYIAEVRYRAKANGLPLPTPPTDPPSFIFSEKESYSKNVWQQYLSLNDRKAIVQEINQTGRIANDTW